MTIAGREKSFLPLQPLLTEIDHQRRKRKKIIENMEKKNKKSIPTCILVAPVPSCFIN